MEQYITVKQLSELTDRQKEKLREWWKPSKGDLFVAMTVGTPEHGFIIDHHKPGYDNKEGLCECDWCMAGSDVALPLLSIGQMVEYLDGDVHIESRKEGFTVIYQPFYDYDPYVNGKEFCKVELCDALWGAVKETLNEN